MTLKTMHVGIDDTDSRRKGCTTYVAALIVEKLLGLGASFIDYPNLIRLNPNVPWKTRGNGALCLRIQYDESGDERIKETVMHTVEENSDLECAGTDPGVVFFNRTTIPKEVKIFATDAITDVVGLKDALKLLTRFRSEALGFKNGRGIIGALAAVGDTLRRDHTYEILAYRNPENLGLKRNVDEASIFDMDKATAPYTFNNVDKERGRVIVTPRGPDPILFGIRGETPEIVKEAFQIVKALEPIERWVIFRTNQGTDAHLRSVTRLNQIKPYTSVIVKGHVAASPKIVPGRHVIFPIKDATGQVDCAAYEPTGLLRRVAMKLIIGDHVEVYGAVRVRSRRRPLTINLEKIRLTKLAPEIVYQNPVCPKCRRRLKSMGKDKGFRCKECGFRTTSLRRSEIRMKREIERALYMTSTRSQRHLTKPASRYGMEKSHETVKKLIDDWHFP